MKTCHDCQRSLPLTEFYSSGKTPDGSPRSPDGLAYVCKDCQCAASMKRYYDKKELFITSSEVMAFYGRVKPSLPPTPSLATVLAFYVLPKFAPTPTKVCSKCHLDKPLTEFYPQGRDGTMTTCKACHYARCRAYRVSDRQQRRDADMAHLADLLGRRQPDQIVEESTIYGIVEHLDNFD